MWYNLYSAMNNFSTNKKSPWRRRFIGGLIGVVLVVIAINFFRNWRTSRSIDSEISDLQNTASTLEQENVQFKQLIEYFNSSAYVEERARIDLGLKKRGEKVVIVPNEFSSSTPSTTEQSSEKSNIGKWLDYFFR